MNRIACLWLPHWPLQRLALARPELSDRPVVLYEESSRGGVHVVVAGEFTFAPQRVLRPHAGIPPGMPLAEALALLMRNSERGVRNANRTPHSAFRAPHFHLVPYDPWDDLHALQDLARWCHRFSPLVGLEETKRPQCLLFDVTGLTELFGGEAAWLQKVLSAFEARGYVVQAAVADTVGAAWAAARHMPMRNSEFGMRNDSIAIPHSAPRTSHSPLIPPGEALAALRSLPVAALRLPAETLSLLARLGLRRIGQVAALPRAALPSRFGPELQRRLDQALGQAPEVIRAQRLPVQFIAECQFETPMHHHSTLEAASARLLGQLAAELARRSEGAVEFQCRFDFASRPSLEVPIGLYRPSHSARHLQDLLRLRLETVRLAEPVTAIVIEVTAAAPLKFKQQELFGGDSTQHHQRHLAGLVDRLSSRLGRQAVLRAAPLNDAQPEYAVVYFPLTAERPKDEFPKHSRHGKYRPRRLGPRTTGAWRPGQRPLRLLSRPALLTVSMAAGQPLQAFEMAGQRYRVARMWGPERIETGWWRTGLVRRDYYRLETTQGSRFWIFQQLDSGQWFLQGEFE